MSFCPECGHEVDDEDKFCRVCGKTLLEEEDEKPKNESNIQPKNEIDDKLIILPIVLGIIGMLIGIVEGLSCPILFGWDFILIELIVSVIGGCCGVFLYKMKNEYLLAGIEFIITGAIMILCIGNMAFIGSIIFIIAGVSSIFIGREYNIKNKINITIPVLTVMIPLILILALGAATIIMEGNLPNQVSVTNVENSIEESYGYYSGSVQGDILLNTSFDYIEMDIEYYDSENRIIYSGIAWSEVNAKSGATYHFDNPYFDEKQPVRAQITIKNNYDADPFYIQNITLA